MTLEQAQAIVRAKYPDASWLKQKSKAMFGKLPIMYFAIFEKRFLNAKMLSGWHDNSSSAWISAATIIIKQQNKTH